MPIQESSKIYSVGAHTHTHTHTHTQIYTRRCTHAQASNNTVLGEIATQLGFDPLGCTVIIVECSARIDIRGKHVAGRLPVSLGLVCMGHLVSSRLAS